MKPFIVIYVLRWYFIHSELYSVCDGFRDTAAAPSLGQKDVPRLLLNQDGVLGSRLLYRSTQNHSVFFQTEGSDDLYVGGTDFVLKVNVDNNSIVEEFSLNTTGTQDGSEGSHQNVITVIQRFQDSLFVCGTNGHMPQCWKLHSQVNNESQEIIESYEGTGISPYVYTHNSLSLIVDGDLYAAAPLDSDGSSLQFRRKAGGRTNVWMYEKWVSEPTFISASWVKREDDPDNEKIYIFFREKNSDSSPEADPWISRVARVCKVDEGGSKRFFQNMWTSFLKARLVCGFPDEPLYFNRLQDVFVQHHEEDWRLTRVYALFTSSWNATALCIYSIADIEEIFDKSTFKGYEKEIPTPRPGTCVRNSRGLPLATVNVVKDHPEMSDWIQPLRDHAPSYTNHAPSYTNHAPSYTNHAPSYTNHAPSYTNHYNYTNRGHAPFYTNHYNYTKIVVDRVQAADQRTYNVLLLATDSGKIHKVLEDGSEPFIIAETQLSNHSAVQSMKLHSRKKKLLVGFREQISILDLQRCSDYNSSCEACVLARDPYCGWTESGCKPTVPGAIQNIPGVQINISCLNPDAAVEDSKKTNNNRTRRDHQSAASPGVAPGVAPGGVAPGVVAVLRAVHSVPLGAPFYLSCPIDSYHARYTWTHHHHRGGRDDVDADHQRTTSHPCQQMQSDCLHLIPAVTRDSYGDYRCVSTERRYTRVVKEYQLAMQSSSPPSPSHTAVIGVAEQDDEKRSVPEGNHGNGGVGLAAPPTGWVAMCVATTAVTVSRLFNV